MGTVNFLIADDHSIIIAGLRTFIESIIDNSIIDSATDAGTAFEKFKHNEYDLVILDANTLAPDPFELVSKMLMLKHGTRILLFSEGVDAKKYFQLGVKGFLTKDASEIEIKNAIKNILDNKRYISASLVELIAEEALGNKSVNPFNNLSPRELEIARHLIGGQSVSEISNTLQLHTSTVGTFKARIFEKTGCKNIISLNDLAKIYKIYSV